MVSLYTYVNGALSLILGVVGKEMYFHSGASSSSSSGSRMDGDTFAENMLLESWPKTPFPESESGTSVNQPEAGFGPPANPVAPPGEEAGLPNPPPRVVPYPYQPDEMIGGDSVLSIQHRILDKSPKSVSSYEEVYQARIDAEDLFEVKVDIINRNHGRSR